jgi:uridine kinase
MKIIYNSKEVDIPENTPVGEAFRSEIENSKFPIIGAKFNNEYKRLDFIPNEEGVLSWVDVSSKGGMKIYRKTLIFIMAKAFEKLYKQAKIRVNYQLAHAMFCTIENMEVTDEILENVQKEMREIVDKNLPITNKAMTRKEAEKLYEKDNSSKGRLQLDLEENEIINMYYCEDYYNYIYEDIAVNTGIVKVFELMKYDDGFLLRYPSSSDPFILQEYQETKKLLWALDEYNDIHKILDVSTVYKLNSIIKNGNIKNLIMLEEALHEKKIAGIADKIADNKNIKMILIAGPSSSGKTTFAQRLGLQLKINGLKPVTISVDNYFVEREQTPRDENGEYDFEDIEAIDLELFNKDLTALLKGETINCPEFDFSVGTKRYKGKTMHLAEDEILVIEGIHCLNDKLTSQIPKEQKYKVYISDLTVLNMDRLNRISTTDTRLIRRIVRDYQFRNYSAEHTLNSWPKVNRGEQKNIFPYQEEADSIFNTSLIYEIAALKEIALPLLEKITPDKKEHAEAVRLINILKYFEPISSEFIPANSLLKEFLGGGYFEY